MEHKLDFEQVKNQWFNDLDNYESKLSLGIENKHLLDQTIYHKKIIQKQRALACSQILIRLFMKKNIVIRNNRIGCINDKIFS